MHYYLFVPERMDGNAAMLRSVGLDGLLREGDHEPAYTPYHGAGPGDQAGMLLTWLPSDGAPPPPLGYLPDRQEWFAVPPDPVRKLPAGRYWIGIDRGQRPRPEDLQRKTDILFEGFYGELGDGRNWLMPNALKLPHRFDFDVETGERIRVPMDRYADLCASSLRMLEACLAQIRGEAVLDADAAFDHAVTMLGLNYRVNDQIAVWLRLFDDTNLGRAVMRTTDCEQISAAMKELKKKATATTAD